MYGVVAAEMMESVCGTRCRMRRTMCEVMPRLEGFWIEGNSWGSGAAGGKMADYVLNRRLKLVGMIWAWINWVFCYLLAL